MFKDVGTNFVVRVMAVRTAVFMLPSRSAPASS